jgi:hypothetical protein
MKPQGIHLMKKLVYFIFLYWLISANAGAQNRPDEALSFSLTDGREVITQDINENLLLRVIKDSSGGGWDIRVVNKPSNINSENLLYHSVDWHGPYPSQIYAWQVVEKYFPNERQLHVRGYDYDVKISLKNTVTDGQGRNARFVSGSVYILWKRKP